MSRVERLCASPGCENIGKHLCSGCGEEIYCSKECQKSHWPKHKVLCKTATKPEAAAFLKSFDGLSVKQLQNLIKAKAASFDANKRAKILAKMEKLVEKPALVKLVEENVLPGEVEHLLSAGPAPMIQTEPIGSSSSKRNSSRKSPKQQVAFEQGPMGTPTPEQLKQQAKMIRNNPGMLRKAQPVYFGKMTDDQIREYADQLDKAATDPAMMQEVERMSKMSDGDRKILQHIQEGLQGTKPVDDKWINTSINALKTKPQLFKTLFKGKGAMFGNVSDEQIEGFIDMASRMDAWTLRWIFKGIRFLASLAKPATDLYNTVDKYTFGMARYIALMLFGIVMYYLTMLSWLVIKFIVLKVYGLVLFIMALVNKTNNGNSSVPVAETVSNVAQSAASAVAGKVKSSLQEAAMGAAAVGAAGAASGMAENVMSAVKKDEAESEFDEF